MNHTYRLVWNEHLTAYVPAPESAHRRGKRSGQRILGVVLLASVSLTAHGLPSGGQVSAGTGDIASSGSVMTVTQQSQNLAINWQSFGIGANESVSFAQPNASAIALNRVLGSDPSQILGALSANGQVWLLNPNGVLFGSTAQVNVGGLVASTLNLSDADFLAGKRTFSGNGGTVTNQGSINTTDGGYVALLGGIVSNEGVIQARLGTVALGSGNQVTLDFAGDQLLSLQVDQGALNALAENKQLIQADGGTVLLSARATDALLDTVVNNSGIIEARTIDTRNGTIKLLGGMDGGTVQVSGTLDASAPNGGNGGFIETSGAQVKVSDTAVITTAAPDGQTGQWLIDPNDLTVAASGGDITGAALSTNLGSSNVLIQSSSGSTAGTGDVNVNDAVSWSADTNLALTASNNVNVNASITASGANAGIALNPNTANGSEAASGSGQFNLASGAAINLPNVSPTSTAALVINGISYTVINSLGSAGSTTGTDLQGMNGNLAGHYALGSNIDASATSSWNGGAGFAPVGNSVNNSPADTFMGTLDGLGHTISGLTINRPSTTYIGLVGSLGSTGTVQNVGVVAANITGSSAVGGLVGYNLAGAISNSYVTGSISGTHTNGATGGLVGINGSLYGPGTIRTSYSAASVSGSGSVGGLVGSNDVGTISDSYSTGAVNGAGNNVGGLVAYNAGTITNSYATGAVTGSATYAGGLAGQNVNTITDSYWDITTSGQSSSEGGTGLTDAQMMQQASFVGFDFTNTWRIYDGHTYPLLRSFLKPLTVTANDASKTYDKIPYSGGNGVTYSDASAVLSGTVSYGGDSQGAVNAGSYTLVTAGLWSTQYDISYGNGTLTINPAPLTVNIVGNPTKVYDGTTTVKLRPKNFSLTGVINGDSVALGKTPKDGNYNSKNVSEATTVTADLSGTRFRAGKGTLLSNYLLPTYASGPGQITPETLTYVADRTTMTQGSSVPPLSGTVSGFVAGETLESATTGTLSWVTNATPNSSPGHYYIDGQGLIANYDNYVFVQAHRNAVALRIRKFDPKQRFWESETDLDSVFGEPRR